MAKASGKFEPIRYEEFNEAWRNLRISRIWFDKSVTTNGKTQTIQQNPIDFLTRKSLEFKAMLDEAAKDEGLKSKFCMAAGLSKKDFAHRLALTREPSRFAYHFMGWFNTAEQPAIYFTVGSSKTLRYASLRAD